MSQAQFSVQKFEGFLSSLVLSPALFSIKSFEEDLYGRLNPTYILDTLFFEKLNWLDFEAFFRYYLDQNRDLILTRFHAIDKMGLRARLYRTQFGFLTEYHAFLLASSFFGAENVYRSVSLDSSGTDFQILISGETYNIHIFVDSERAWHYREIKSATKRVESVPGVHVNLPYSCDANRFNSVRYLPNGFGVYREEYFRFLLDELNTGKISNNNIIGTSPTGFVYR